ncbi:hypothetical protein CLV56_3575 [Mumia flava]|uniref:Uncharacterized protein n=1 Tax=Mumia flava TaxID=1348852 RepID=A0A2M9B823_9ACTN|nr:hypothetical protein [Mumia flava]PJJ54071.1 hypothetical protein CLV56_3575 [Mumia flava]
MYEMQSTEWGPSRHRDGHAESSDAWHAVQTALDLRDNGGPRPDDN